jgi:hypothetical protein
MYWQRFILVCQYDLYWHTVRVFRDVSLPGPRVCHVAGAHDMPEGGRQLVVTVASWEGGLGGP